MQDVAQFMGINLMFVVDSFFVVAIESFSVLCFLYLMLFNVTEKKHIM